MLNDTQPTLEMLTKEVSKMLNEEHLDPDKGLMELGVSSLNIIEIMLVIELIYGDFFEPDQLSVDAYTTLRELDSQLCEISKSWTGT